MKTLPKDLIEKILNNVSAEDFLSYCETDRHFSNDSQIWMRRFKKDFGNCYDYLFDIDKINDRSDWKKLYKQFFYKSDLCVKKNIQNILELYGDVAKYLSVEYIKLLYDTFFKLTLDCLLCVLKCVDVTMDQLLNEYLHERRFGEKEFRPLVNYVIGKTLDIFLYRNKNTIKKWEKIVPPAIYHETYFFYHSQEAEEKQPLFPFIEDMIENYFKQYFESTYTKLF